MSKQYDFIIAGAGAAGLSLAYQLNHSPLRHKRILLIDQSLKQADDRTWCFWAKTAGDFAPIVRKSWDKIWFRSPQFSQCIALAPYRYFMISGIDFYNYVLDDLRQNPNIDIKLGVKASAPQNEDGAASIWVDGEKYQAHWLFNSFYKFPQQQKAGYHYFKQHFKGLVIKTAQDCFDPDAATFMDFRIPQAGEARFFYILPQSKRQALVEFTIFSEQLLTQKAYDQALEDYLANYLQIQDYEVLKEEFGIIPMVDEGKEIRQGDHILNIGTKGGYTKASTGFSFHNIQKNSRAILQSLQQYGHPFALPPAAKRFQVYDSMLLRLMRKAQPEARDLFAIMFQKHPVARIFRFLDEESYFTEELLIMAKMPPLPFLKALGEITYERGRQFLGKKQMQ